MNGKALINKIFSIYQHCFRHDKSSSFKKKYEISFG